MAKGEVAKGGLSEALEDPMRRQILRRMRDVDVSSPSELAGELGRRTNLVAYHVGVLSDCGALTLVREEPVRGAVRHIYRNSLKPLWAKQIIDLEEPWKGRAPASGTER